MLVDLCACTRQRMCSFSCFPAVVHYSAIFMILEICLNLICLLHLFNIFRLTHLIPISYASLKSSFFQLGEMPDVPLDAFPLFYLHPPPSFSLSLSPFFPLVFFFSLLFFLFIHPSTQYHASGTADEIDRFGRICLFHIRY